MILRAAPPGANLLVPLGTGLFRGGAPVAVVGWGQARPGGGYLGTGGGSIGDRGIYWGQGDLLGTGPCICSPSGSIGGTIYWGQATVSWVYWGQVTPGGIYWEDLLGANLLGHI